MSATKTPQREKKKQKDAELVVGGVGQWVIDPSGKFYDQQRQAWIMKCHGCGKTFYAKRRDAKTHSEACRKKISRLNLERRNAEQQSA